MADLNDRLRQVKTLGATGKLANSIKDAIVSAIDRLNDTVLGIKDYRFEVEVANKDTNLHKEVAENTRKTASRLKQLVEKSVQKVDGSVSITNKTLRVEVTNPQESKDVQKVEVTNPTKIEFPEIPKPLEEVRVSNLSEIEFPEQKVEMLPLVNAVESLKSVVSEINGQLPGLKPKEIKFPKLEVPKQMSLKESKQLIEAINDGLQGVRDDLGRVYKAIEEQEPVVQKDSGGKTIVSSARVTDVNINGLRGVPKSTAVTVGSTATKLPETNLQYRRSIIVYNDSENTVYIGGSDVTTSNGLPVAVDSYSPPIDAGETMNVYAVATTNSNVRVLEVSSQREGS